MPPEGGPEGRTVPPGGTEGRAAPPRGVRGDGSPRERGGLGGSSPRATGRERERQDLRAVRADGVGHDRQPHRLADGQPGRVGFGQPGLDHDLAGQLDVAQRVRLEGLGPLGAVVGRARRPEVLRGERPQRAPVREQRLGDLGPAAPLAGRPGREPDQAAARAPRPDQPGLVGGPGEQALRHWNLPGSGHRRAPARRPAPARFVGTKPTPNTDNYVNSLYPMMTTKYQCRTAWVTRAAVGARGTRVRSDQEEHDDQDLGQLRGLARPGTR